VSVKYPHNFLKNVTARIDFGKNYYEISSDVPGAVKARMKEQFPFVQRKKAIAEQMQVVSETEVKRSHVSENHWFHQAKDGSKTICLAPNFMWLDYKKYEEFADLKSTFSGVTESLFESLPDFDVSRFGLRYFNNIELTDPHLTDWDAYLDKNLLSIFNLADDRTKISRAFHNLELNFGDMNLTFLYGMHNPDYPAPIKQKTFVLDFDAYILKSQDKDEVVSNLEVMHERIQSMFEKNITEQLREIMR
jgi:uncharacterized protein (TIGR04255 family)